MLHHNHTPSPDTTTLLAEIINVAPSACCKLLLLITKPFTGTRIRTLLEAYVEILPHPAAFSDTALR
jgi:hypothetical protein